MEPRWRTAPIPRGHSGSCVPAAAAATQVNRRTLRRRVVRAALVLESFQGLASTVCRIPRGARSCRSVLPSLLLALALSGAAVAQVKIGLMVSATGPTTAIGIPQKNTGELLPQKIGDVDDRVHPVDDGGDTTRAVQNVKKLIQEHNIDALIGPSTTPNALAILDVIAEGKVPLMATVGTLGGGRAARREEALGVQDHAERRPHRRGAGQAHGEDRREDARLHRLQGPVRRELAQGVRAAWPRRRASSSSATECYLRTDPSVTGQALKLLAGEARRGADRRRRRSRRCCRR